MRIYVYYDDLSFDSLVEKTAKPGKWEGSGTDLTTGERDADFLFKNEADAQAAIERLTALSCVHGVEIDHDDN